MGIPVTLSTTTQNYAYAPLGLTKDLMSFYIFFPLQEVNSNGNHTDNDVTSCPAETTPDVTMEAGQNKGKLVKE